MKKTITTLLFLFLTLGLFAETGYAGIQWNSHYFEVDAQEIERNIKSKTKTMLGIKTNLYYHFYGRSLKGISYYLPNSKSKELKTKYNNLVKQIAINSFNKNEWIDLLSGDDPNSKERIESVYDIVTNKACFEMSQDLENISDLFSTNNKKATIYIYNYNNDTRVYLFENVIKDELYVVYTYHEQDF